MNNSVLNFFTEKGEFSNIGIHKNDISNISNDVKILTQIIQGNLMHDGFYKHYGLKHQSGLYHYMEDLLGQIKKNDSNPITVPRSPNKQVQVCCRDYAVLLTSLLRAKKIPARARCGFDRFDKNEQRWWDHWICEYWNNEHACWKKVDAQLNPHVQQAWMIKFDPFDVPDDIFHVAGKAWYDWRNKKIDASRFIIDELNGSWLIRGNLLRDFAALNKVEIEPYMMRINLRLNWNSWRLVSIEDDELSDKDWLLLDKIALLTIDADRYFNEIRSLFQENIELQPPKDLFPRFRLN
ncbi:MAG: Transglutaminase domain protein [Candidatus Curtissbacteria bacterium GW2011_GWA1_40_16]|uniref:Transglutaminase domain protein n=1 Tax=Candidatus Curtissbacteria bacterium GW2011_GWA1_40_16 TaxID=1618405 RepID=A0A0G0REJ0_9BACT|nr:MAG: Transglutaminase domain protein [Candidatus Curtissbacteria bacterium GW2011_GWA1_40_16]